jgi:hypothetical protein
MKLVALVRAPSNPAEAAVSLAEASGVALAEARMRLARQPPALLTRLEEARADALAAALRKAGLAALSVDDHCPTDKDRLPARTFSLDDAGAVFTARSGDTLNVTWPDLSAILWGARASRSQVERSDKSKHFSVGMAVATGGLKMTRTSTQTQRSSEESSEQVILAYARDGRAVTLAEHGLDFSCLGAGMQPSSTANMAELARRLRERAKTAYFDNRLLQLGRRPLPFLAGGESSSRSGNTTVTHTSTSDTLDVLAEVMRQALAQGLLP